MDYRWRYQDAEGQEVAGPDERFADQAEAEEWFSAQWTDLREAGVRQVVLLAGDDEVYGPMSLDPA
jgi:hypothetical protein